ncbi:MAG: DNA internalization-related competence protein ComEC/Rec2 [bacterium]
MLTPIIVTTISYVLGIISGKFLFIPIQYLLFALVLSVLASLFLLKSGQRPVYLIFLLIFILGIFARQYSSAVPANDVSHFADDRYARITGSVADEPLRSEGYCRFILKAKKIAIRGRSSGTSGYVGVIVKNSSQTIGYGNRISVHGKLSKIVSTSNPGVASFGDLMARRKINCQMFANDTGIEVIAGSTGNPIKFVSMIIKNRLISVIQNTMNEPYSSLLGSIVFGSQASPLPDELQDKYRTAGVIHLLVVSGTQVSIILTAVLTVCRALGLSRSLRLMIVTLANLMFTVMTGAGPSIVRAAVMCEVALIADAFERETDFYNSLSISALVLLVLNPLSLFDVGFQLSFLATWALFYIAPAVGDRIKEKLPQFFANTIAISVAPTIATAPVIFYNFGQVSFVSIISNLLIIPWIEITVILGFISTLIGLVFIPLAYALNNTLTVMLAMLNGIVHLFSCLPFACGYFAPPNFALMLIYYMILVGGIEMIKGRVQIKFNKAVLLVFILLLIGFFRGTSIAANDLTITFIDVGQGDAILIESPSGKKALIDGGGRQENLSSKGTDKEDPTGKTIIVPFLRKKGINELDLVILTHPHDDHVAGLPYVLEKIKVDMVLDSGQPHTSRGYSRFLKLIERKKIPYKIARAGQVIDLGGGVKGQVLHPSEPLISGTESDLNNNSVVIKLVYGRTSFLFTGDAAFEAEARILSLRPVLASDVLKVGHHGSRTSTSAGFLEAVRPKYAVICVGAKNKFGHPTPETLGRLAKYSIKVLRTDLGGAVIFKSDGAKVYPQ